MSDPITTAPATDPEEVTPEPVEPAATPVEEEKPLGAAGEKALAAMKAERKTDREKIRELNAKIEKSEADAALKDKPAEEQALEAARAEARAEVTTKANERLLRSELKAAATGKMADPTDAALYLDLTSFDVNDDGDVDSDALADAIAELLTRKPHLGMPDARKFGGSADQGAKGKPAAPAQLTENDVSRMTPSQINKARQQGLLKEYLGQSS
jgi:hypothetical protein